MQTLRYAAACALLFALPAHADLIGSSVTVTGEYGCLTSACAFGGPTTQVVTSNTVFGTLVNDGTVTVTGTQLIWTATKNATYGSAGFNGFEFDFTGAPPLLSAALDPASTLGLSTNNFASGFKISGNTIWMDLSGLSATTGQKAILDINPSPVPLPASAWLLLSGLLGIGVMTRRRLTA